MTTQLRRGPGRYGYKRGASRIAANLLDATQYFRDARLPELFCDSTARRRLPVPYPRLFTPGMGVRRYLSTVARCWAWHPMAAATS